MQVLCISVFVGFLLCFQREKNSVAVHCRNLEEELAVVRAKSDRTQQLHDVINNKDEVRCGFSALPWLLTFLRFLYLILYHFIH